MRSAGVRPRRADAARNAEKVLAAAREVFAERGPDAGVDEIATRAGVGKATIYRCWATKEELVTAVVGQRVDWFTEQTLAAIESDDTWRAYIYLLEQAAASACSNQLLHAGLTSAPRSPELEVKRAASTRALQGLLDKLAAEGIGRPDLTAREVIVLLSGAFRTLSEEGVTDIAQWQRYAELVVVMTRSTRSSSAGPSSPRS
ncbi:MAG: TetR/AcrR family transcriptional regulator [Frankiales bacterium]|jgi:AcrR family transcriptional regulator|nr:TetR/AcrR family transcriptional regulator [Frankiales bacterium]